MYQFLNYTTQGRGVVQRVFFGEHFSRNRLDVIFGTYCPRGTVAKDHPEVRRKMAFKPRHKTRWEGEWKWYLGGHGIQASRCFSKISSRHTYCSHRVPTLKQLVDIPKQCQLG
jgi:hypothetical protein